MAHRRVVQVAGLLLVGMAMVGCGQAASAGPGSSAGSGSSQAAASAAAQTATSSSSSGGTSIDAPQVSATALKAAALALLADYNQKNAQAVCDDLDQPTTTWMTDVLAQAQPRASCADLVSLAFGPTTNGDMAVEAPAFKRISVLAWGGVGMRDGYGRVRMLVQVHYPGQRPANSPLNEPHELILYFTQTTDGLRLARFPEIRETVAGGDADPASEIEPTTKAESLDPVKIAPPTFPCTGPTQTSSDQANDVSAGTNDQDMQPVTAPWLDIRRIITHGLATPHPCIEIDLAAPVRPPTEIQVMGDTSPYPTVAIGANNDYATSIIGLDLRHHLRPYGERGAKIYLAIEPSYSPVDYDQLHICISSPAITEPFIQNPATPIDGWEATQTPSETAASANTYCGT